MNLITSDLIKETNDLINSRDKVLEYHFETQKNWLKTIGEAIKHTGNIGNLLLNIEAQLVYSVWEVWEGTDKNGNFLSREAKVDWDGDFFRWAKTFTRKQIREPAETTIKHKITTHAYWDAAIPESEAEDNADVIIYPDDIFIPRRNGNGEIINDEWKQIKFNKQKYKSAPFW